MNSEAFQWFIKIFVDKWSLVYDGDQRFGMMTTNLFECFNRVLKNSRFLSITLLVQLIFFRLVFCFDYRHAQVKDALNRSERFTPFATAHLIANQFKATSHTVIRFDRIAGVFQVQTAYCGSYTNKDNNTQVNMIAKPSFYDRIASL